MKRFTTMLATMLLSLAAGLPGTADARATGTLPGQGGSSCSNQYINCMFSGRPAMVCSQQRAECERAFQVLLPVSGARAANELSKPVDAEGDAMRFRALLANATPATATLQMGSTYCLKMLYRCDAGDMSACRLFDRYCGG